MRLQFDITKSAGEYLIDVATRTKPVLIDEREYELSIGLFDNDVGQDLTGIDACNVTCYYNTTVVLFTKTYTAAMDSELLRLTQWNNGFERNFAITVSAAELNYAFGEGETELDIYFVVTGTFGVNSTVLGRGAATLQSIAGVPQAPAPIIKLNDYTANSILAADTAGVPTARTITEATIVGRQFGGTIGSISQVSVGEIAGGGASLRAFAPDDVADMIAARLTAYANLSAYTTHSVLAATIAGTPTARQLAAQEILGRQSTGEIGGIPRVALSEIAEGDSEDLRAFTPWDIAQMVGVFATSGVDLPPSSLRGRQSTGPETSIPKASLLELAAGTETNLRGTSPSDLKYVAQKWGAGSGGAGGVSDGDKGDVIVSSNGSVWTLDTTAVTAAAYKSPNLTIDAKGRITLAAAGPVGFCVQVFGPGTSHQQGAGKAYFYVPVAFTLTDLYVDFGTAGTGGDTIIDVNKGGTSVISGAKLTVAAGATATSKTGADLAVTAFAARDLVTIDVDTIASTTAGAGLVVNFVGTLA